MRQRYRFRPSGGERLERRLVLSSAALIAPVTARPLSVAPAAKLDLNDRVATAVNQAFASFQNDYLQAQGTYFADLSTSSGEFANYITQRVQLLASDLIRALTQLPGSLNTLTNGSGDVGAGGGGIVLQSFLRRHIINSAAPGRSGSTSLYQELQANRESVTSTNTPTPEFIALFTLNATTSIATAQTTTLNSIRFLIHNTFQNGHA